MAENAIAKVRFAPSPTGYLHIGGARTALFNWMYAKSVGGKFILRIEDTDQKRSTKEFEQEILYSLKWLGLNWDELFYQSSRFDIYREHAKKLLDTGKAYEEKGAILLKMPKRQIKIYDLIRGEIDFDTANFMMRDGQGNVIASEEGGAVLKDEVLIKADGSPAYNFCCVVDDALMEMTCIIRGEDHISNTPKQIIIYEAFGWKPPKFAHLPLILDSEGGRLSKRAGAVAVSDYKAQGFLPEALVNYLMLLGWAPGNNQEIIDLSSAVKKFSIKKVNKAGAIFSLTKLKWVNSEYIKKLSVEKLAEALIPFLEEKGYISRDFDRQRLTSIVKLFQGRLSTLTEFLEWADFIFVERLQIEGKAKDEHLSKNRSKEFMRLSERLNAVGSFDSSTTEKIFREVVGEFGLKASDLVHPVRVALTGRAVGPGLFETMSVLGKEKTIQRLREAFQ